MIKAMMVGLALAGSSYIVKRPCPEAAKCEDCGCRAAETCEHVKGDKPYRADGGWNAWPRIRCVIPDAGSTPNS